MVHFISVPALSYLFPIFPPREAHTQNSYLPFFLSVFISFYDIVICLEWPKLNHTFYPLSPSTTFFFPWELPPLSPSLVCPFNPFSFFPVWFVAFRLHAVTSAALPFMLCWGGFCLLSWLLSSIYWNKSSGISLKRKAWDVNVWLLPRLRMKISLHLTPNR